MFDIKGVQCICGTVVAGGGRPVLIVLNFSLLSSLSTLSLSLSLFPPPLFPPPYSLLPPPLPLSLSSPPSLLSPPSFLSFSPPLLLVYRATTIDTTDSANQPRVGGSSSTTDHLPPFRTLSTPGRPNSLISPSTDKPAITGSGPRKERYQSQPVMYVAVFVMCM